MHRLVACCWGSPQGVQCCPAPESLSESSSAFFASEEEREGREGLCGLQLEPHSHTLRACCPIPQKGSLPPPLFVLGEGTEACFRTLRSCRSGSRFAAPSLAKGLPQGPWPAEMCRAPDHRIGRDPIQALHKWGGADSTHLCLCLLLHAALCEGEQGHQ